jgi:hypothetical protein
MQQIPEGVLNAIALDTINGLKRWPAPFERDQSLVLSPASRLTEQLTSGQDLLQRPNCNRSQAPRVDAVVQNRERIGGDWISRCGEIEWDALGSRGGEQPPTRRCCLRLLTTGRRYAFLDESTVMSTKDRQGS